MKTVLIFGGSGFVGRHIIRRIAKNGYKIIVPHQNPVNEAGLRLLGVTGQIIPIRFRSLKEEKILTLINKSDVIINLKTMWDEKKISYKEGILDFNIELINSLKKNNEDKKFIYFSGLGVDNQSSSERTKNIYNSEKYIKENLDNFSIIRPGIIIGGDDQFLNGLLPLFKKSFFIPLFGSGLCKFQPVFVDDVSLAINKIIKSNFYFNDIIEIVGNEIFTYKDFYNYISACMNKTRVLVPIKFNMAKVGVSILEKTPFSPLNSEQLNLFKQDNIASNNFKNLSDLDITSQDLTIIVKKIIIKNL